MTTPRQISISAFVSAVLTALVVGVLASLAIRPPGPGRMTADDQSGAFASLSWRVPSPFGSNLPVLGEMGHQFAAELADLSAGQLAVEIFDPGELVPAFSIGEAVKEGKIDAGLTWLGYDQGRIPAATLIGAVPFGMEPWEFTAWWYESGGRALGEALYEPHGVVPILCGLIGPETAGWFRQPIDSLDDIRGLKIRFSGLGGKVMQRLGASVTVMPGGEIFQALEKGAIDATEFSQPVIDEMLGFDRVASYNYFPGWHQTSSTFHLVVNAAVWADLPGQTQAALRTVCRSVVTWSLARSEALQGEVIEGFAARGVSAEVFSPEVLAALADETEALLNEEAASDSQFARILESQRQFRERYGRWKELGYLPRDFGQR